MAAQGGPVLAAALFQLWAADGEERVLAVLQLEAGRRAGLRQTLTFKRALREIMVAVARELLPSAAAIALLGKPEVQAIPNLHVTLADLFSALDSEHLVSPFCHRLKT